MTRQDKSVARTPSLLHRASGFALCGFIKVAFEGDVVSAAILLAATVLCELAAIEVTGIGPRKGAGPV